MSRYLLIVMLIATVLLGGCVIGGAPELITQVAPTEAPTAVPPTVAPTAVPPTAVPPTAAPTAVPPTAVPPTAAPTAVPPTEAPTAAPTAVPPTAAPTLAPTAVPTTAVPPTETPKPTPALTETPVPVPLATTAGAEVTAKTGLNLRGGPGTNYPIIGALTQGDTLAITGQANDCAWLAVKTPSGGTGWVTGSADLVTLNGTCATINAAVVPPTPTPAPTKAPASAAPGAASAAAPATDTKPPTEPELPADKGCYLIISYVGDELTVTFSSKERQWDTQFKLPAMGQYLLCLDPGRYSYTMNHPKWNGGGELTVQAGQHYRFPVTGQP